MVLRSQQICSICQSKFGSVYGVTRSGLLHEFSFRSINNVPLHTPGETDSIVPSRHFFPDQPLGFVVQTVHVSCNGRFALMLGEYGGMPFGGVLDLSGGELRRDPATNHIVELSSYSPVPDDWIFGKEGVQIAHVEWLPGCDTHFAVLGSNDHWSVYGVDEEVTLEQNFRLEMSGRGVSGLGGVPGRAVSFAFTPSVNWGAFGVCFLRHDGALFLMCPVVLPQPGITNDFVCALERDLSGIGGDAGKEEISSNWLSTVFEACEGGEGYDEGCLIANQLPDWWANQPALQGPLNPTLKSLFRSQDEAKSVWMTHDNGTVLAFVCSANGLLSVYALEGVINPDWNHHKLQRVNPKPYATPLITAFQQSPNSCFRLMDEFRLACQPSNRVEVFLHPNLERDKEICVVRDEGVYVLRIPWLCGLGAVVWGESDGHKGSYSGKAEVTCSGNDVMEGQAVHAVVSNETVLIVAGRGQDLTVAMADGCELDAFAQISNSEMGKGSAFGRGILPFEDKLELLVCRNERLRLNREGMPVHDIQCTIDQLSRHQERVTELCGRIENLASECDVDVVEEVRDLVKVESNREKVEAASVGAQPAVQQIQERLGDVDVSKMHWAEKKKVERCLEEIDGLIGSMEQEQDSLECTLSKSVIGKGEN